MRKMIKISIPGSLSQEPVIYHLAHDFDVEFNITKGRFTSAAANLVIVLKGLKKNIEKAIAYLSDKGVQVESEE